VLRCLAGKNREEVARELGCPVGTVESRLARARERLRAGLARRGFVLPAAGLAAGLAPRAAGAGVVTPLVISTVKAAVLVAVGQAIPGGVVSVRAVALMEGVLRAMLVSKLKRLTAVLLVLLFLGPPTGLLACRALAQGPTAPKDPQVLAGGDQRGPHFRWEYKVLTRPEVERLALKKGKKESLLEGLNLLGSEGWQLAAVEPGMGGANPAAFGFNQPMGFGMNQPGGFGAVWNTPGTYLFKRPR
jgi:hypothetical protein